jgi:hypothetical protein
MSLPKNLIVSVWPYGDGWKVVCRSPTPLEDKGCFELIRRAADRLKLKFDLHLYRASPTTTRAVGSEQRACCLTPIPFD